MLKTYAVYFSFLRSILDIVIISLIWLAVYYIRFCTDILGSAEGIPSFESHLVLMVPITCICYLACVWAGLYKPKRIQSMFKHIVEFLNASVLSGLMVLTFFYYIKDEPYSRKMLVLFVTMLFWGLFLSHLQVRCILRLLRKKGYNLRHYAVIGSGYKGRMLVEDMNRIPWVGMKCVFFIDNAPDRIGKDVLGVPVYGPVDHLTQLVKDRSIDEVYCAMEGSEAQRVYPILESLQFTGVTIRIIPDWGNLLSISMPIAVPIGTQVLFSAADSPLSGFNVILKRLFDLVVSLILLAVLSVPMLVIALLIKLGSDGPVFFKQSRVRMDQREFEMLKFRTMRNDAEAKGGAQWSRQNDDRCTAIGRWLRRTSLDELPQLINVVRGQMSLVGPRPERPVFVEQFSQEYRRYMLRHKVKAGLTGWAQINGFRGDTSLRKRLVYDLYYVTNWSFALDLWVLLRTPWHVVKGENAH